jgi:hypothetical protein
VHVVTCTSHGPGNYIDRSRCFAQQPVAPVPAPRAYVALRTATSAALTKGDQQAVLPMRLWLTTSDC